MLYLESKLTQTQIDRFDKFAKSLGSSINELCDTSATAQIGEFSLDVFELDDLIAKNVPEYDQHKCIYKGDKASCADVIGLEYGADIEAILQKLLNRTTERKDER